MTRKTPPPRKSANKSLAKKSTQKNKRAPATKSRLTRKGSKVEVAKRTVDKTPTQAPSHKLQKVLADLGYGPRRQMEQWIAAGQVAVNGEPAHVGQRVTSADNIEVVGRKVRPAKLAAKMTTRIILLNKKVGTICSRSDPEGRPHVFKDLPVLRSGRWLSVGRLDIQTAGLLMFTNSGELANALMHPSTGLDREYAVRVNGILEDEQLELLKSGLIIEGDKHQFSDIRYFNGSGHNHWYHVVLMEGKNREVRRLFESQGMLVSRLKRVRFGPVILPSWLRVGKHADFAAIEIAALHDLLNLPYELPKQGGTRGRGKLQKPEKYRPFLIEYPGLNLAQT